VIIFLKDVFKFSLHLNFGSKLTIELEPRINREILAYGCYAVSLILNVENQVFHAECRGAIKLTPKQPELICGQWLISITFYARKLVAEAMGVLHFKGFSALAKLL